jgi:acyl carrier protein
MSVESQIRKYILEDFLYAQDETCLQDTDSFLEEGIVDSTGILELVMFVEETFGVQVEDEDIVPEHFDSVERLARYVRRKTGVDAQQETGDIVADVGARVPTG